jgi:hypothetical protein
MSHTLHIGFSFAIRQDGSPGICNQAIARRMLQQWQEAPGSGKPDMGAQWEIYDALEEMGAPVETMFPGAALVAKPPRVEASHIGSRERVLGLLASEGAPAQNELLRELQGTARWRQIRDGKMNPTHAQLAAVLDELLDSPTLYVRFRGLLGLRDLHRSNRGVVGLEKRDIPVSGAGGRDGLRRFQSVRVNRLILEEILPEKVTSISGSYESTVDVLKRPAYLNVGEVAWTILTAVAKRSDSVERVLVHAHPHHEEWCVGQTAAIAKKLELTLGEVSAAKTANWSDEEKWDMESAQVWCRSLRNWEHYQRL